MSETAETTTDPNVIPPPTGDQDNRATAPEPAEGAEQSEDGEPAKPEREPWHAKRIRSLDRANGRLRSQNDALAARLEDLERRVGGSGQDNQAREQQQAPAGRAEPQQQRQQLVDQGFADAVQAITKPGIEAYGDWNDVTKGWEHAGLDLGNKEHRDLVGYIATLPNPGATWYALAKDPDRAAELLEMSPRQQAVALRDFAPAAGASTSAQAAVASKAPPPAKPAVAPRGQSAGTSRNVLDPKMPQADFDEAMRKILRR